MEKKLVGNYTRMLRAILNKSRRQHPTKQKLYSHLPPISKTIQVRPTRHARYCWRSRDELISDVFLRTPSHGRAKAGRQARTYIRQLFADIGCSFEEIPEAIDDREGRREKVRDIRADSVTWWWWLRKKPLEWVFVYNFVSFWVGFFLSPFNSIFMWICPSVCSKYYVNLFSRLGL